MVDARFAVKYFPVHAGPFRMRPGLHRFGTDFGNGEWDATFFQPVDESTLAEKRRVLTAHPERVALAARSVDCMRVHATVLPWMVETVSRELGIDSTLFGSIEGSIERLDSISQQGSIEQLVRRLSVHIGEDFVVLRREAPAADPRISLASVGFPSGWAPERILGQSFSEIHAPVPEFDAVAQRAPSLVSAMIEKGPYVRFVWTVTSDAALDHHPSGARAAWSDAAAGTLRVERQVTVPFAAEDASLFLIRTYVTPFDELTTEQRRDLARSIEGMSDAVLRYKGIDRATATGLLRR